MQNRALIYIVCVVACASLLLLVIAEQGMVEPTPISTERLLVNSETGATGNSNQPTSDTQRPTSFISGKPNSGLIDTGHEGDAKHQSHAESSYADTLESSQSVKLVETDAINRTEDGWSTLNDQSVGPTASIDDSPSRGEFGGSFLLNDSPAFSQSESDGNRSNSTSEPETSLTDGFTRVSDLPLREENATVTQERARNSNVTRVSMIDRPELRNNSSILQVQNQEPTQSQASNEEEGGSTATGRSTTEEDSSFFEEAFYSLRARAVSIRIWIAAIPSTITPMQLCGPVARRYIPGASGKCKPKASAGFHSAGVSYWFTGKLTGVSFVAHRLVRSIADCGKLSDGIGYLWNW